MIYPDFHYKRIYEHVYALENSINRETRRGRYIVYI